METKKCVGVEIGGRLVGPECEPLIVAEMSGNHQQSLAKAKSIVDAAADAGAHAIKLQTYKPETLTMDIRDRPEFWQTSEDSLWKGRHLFDLYAEAMTPWEWHGELFAHAQSRGLLAFSSPFDETAVDFLESLHVPCYKIASPENVDLRLIRKVAATGKPVIASLGSATLDDIHFLTANLERYGCPRERQILLKCTSAYPASPKDANVATLPHMREMLAPAQVGLSDHSHGIGVAVAAVALGAVLVEKHFCLDRSEGGVDSAFSLEPAELAALVTECKRGWEAVGKVSYAISAAEEDGRKYKRSLFVARDMKEGEAITEANVISRRPGSGLSTKYSDLILGQRINQDLKRGTPLQWSHVA